MKKIFYTMAVAAALFAGYSAYNAQNSNELSDVALANVEALAGSSESGISYGCGRAVYESDDDWYEDTKTFKWCSSGCPDAEGTSPKYINC